MTTLTARVAVLTAAFATALFVSGCTSPASDGHGDHDHGTATSAAAQGGGGQERSDSGSGPVFNDADVTFANDMIPHHQQAVELSKLVPGRTTNQAVINLAAAVSAAQQPEITTMTALLAQWTGGQPTSHEGHDMSAPGMQGMQGMVDDATMARLKTLTGADFDTLWLQSMIGHHEGAIAMAKTEIADGANVDAKRLAQQIADAQQAEITQMKSMVGG